jgi:hypothetical protein
MNGSRGALKRPASPDEGGRFSGQQAKKAIECLTLAESVV